MEGLELIKCLYMGRNAGAVESRGTQYEDSAVLNWYFPREGQWCWISD